MGVQSEREVKSGLAPGGSCRLTMTEITGRTATAGLPQDAKARKDIPIARGVLDYFPLALAAVAELSRIGNEQHNPGQPLHWARGKSTDHADCIVRHLIERGSTDADGVRHSTKVAWRALALLQTEIEEANNKPAIIRLDGEDLSGWDRPSEIVGHPA